MHSIACSVAHHIKCDRLQPAMASWLHPQGCLAETKKGRCTAPSVDSWAGRPEPCNLLLACLASRSSHFSRRLCMVGAAGVRSHADLQIFSSPDGTVPSLTHQTNFYLWKIGTGCSHFLRRLCMVGAISTPPRRPSNLQQLIQYSAIAHSSNQKFTLGKLAQAALTFREGSAWWVPHERPPMQIFKSPYPTDPSLACQTKI